MKNIYQKKQTAVMELMLQYYGLLDAWKSLNRLVFRAKRSRLAKPNKLGSRRVAEILRDVPTYVFASITTTTSPN